MLYLVVMNVMGWGREIPVLARTRSTDPFLSRLIPKLPHESGSSGSGGGFTVKF